MKILVLIISLLSMSVAHASSDYEKILDHVSKGKKRAALVLLEDYLEHNPPLFRSYFLLGYLYLDTGQAAKSIKALDKAPEQERGGNYWFLKMNAYLKSTDRSESRLQDMATALDRLIETVGYLTEGADETLFEAAEIVGGGRVRVICEKYELGGDVRCGE